MSDVASDCVESLFFDAFSWYCEKIDLSVEELIGHLRERFEAGFSWPKLRDELLIDSPIQLAAENAVIHFLSDEPSRIRSLHQWSDVPGRDVDWTRTSLAQSVGRMQYCNRSRRLTSDQAFVAALASLARRWSSVLSNDVRMTDDRKARLSRLQRVLPSTALPNVGWGLAHSRRARFLHPLLGKSIDEACLLERRGIRGVELSEQFNAWLEREWASPSVNDDALRAINSDNLFEWAVALCLARAAVLDGWTLVNQRADRSARPAMKYGELWFEHGDRLPWRLCISKGRPGTSADSDDLVRKYMKDAGLGATGLQPDIVIRFMSDSGGARNCYTFLADAKRNANSVDAGRQYVRESIVKAASYLHAFQKVAVLPPRMTLFFWQGVPTVLGQSVGTSALTAQAHREVAARLLAFKADDLLCLDRRFLTAEESSPCTQTTLAAWFKCLFRQAQRASNADLVHHAIESGR